MTARRSVRDRWIDEVLRTDRVGLSCKIVLWALSLLMADGGRVDEGLDRKTLAEQVDLPLTRVSDRLAEARRAGLLARVGGGYNGQPTIWQATLPEPGKVPTDGVPSRAGSYPATGYLPGPKVTGDGVPSAAPEGTQPRGSFRTAEGTPPRGTHDAGGRAGARAFPTEPDSQAAPVEDRGSRLTVARNRSRNSARPTPPTSSSASSSISLVRPAEPDKSAPTFNDFYGTYPRKEAKRRAEAAWRGAVKRADPQTIMAGLARFRFAADRQFIPLPASWLNADRWADEPPATSPAQAPAWELVGDSEDSGRGLPAQRVDEILGVDSWQPRYDLCPFDPEDDHREYSAWLRRERAEHLDQRRRLAAAKLDGRTSPSLRSYEL